MVEPHREWCLVARTPIWTGSVRIDNDRERIQNARLVTTGLLGSIRWWFEVLVRGLGGSACDPSNTQCQDNKHCVACELFGCTEWARKFRFQVLAGQSGDEVQSGSLGKNAQFRFRFVPLRTVTDEEWELLDLTLRLIANYGAIGGKTVLKPSDEDRRKDEDHHKDHGIVSLEARPEVPSADRAALERYVASRRWGPVRHNDCAWASLSNLWFVGGKHLTRESTTNSSFNRVVGRHEGKECQDCEAVHDPPRRCDKTKRHPRRRSEQLATNGAANRWLAGQQGESKKVFSFKDPRRTFGFLKKPGTVDLAQIKERLKQAWPDMTDDEVVTGDAILDNLFRNGAPAP